MTKKSYLNDRFLCLIEIIVRKMLKLLKIPGFLSKLSQISGFPGFFA